MTDAPQMSRRDLRAWVREELVDAMEAWFLNQADEHSLTLEEEQLFKHELERVRKLFGMLP
jgi:hypothetical protein